LLCVPTAFGDREIVDARVRTWTRLQFSRSGHVAQLLRRKQMLTVCGSSRSAFPVPNPSGCADAILFDLFAHKFPESAVFTPSHPLDASAGNAEAEAAARVDDSLPFTSLGLDSLDVVELLVAVEKNFGVELADEEHESVKNVNDLIEKIYNHPRAA
jgi:acyl carrier protein